MKGAVAIANPEPRELFPIARSGLPSLNPMSRIDASANCMDIPIPVTSNDESEIQSVCENQSTANPID